MKHFIVTGMSCAACQTRVEKAVSEVEGVDSCAVNLLTGSMGVEGNASDESIIAAVEKAGYGAFVKNEKNVKQEDDILKDNKTPKIKRRLIVSLCFLAPLMYLSMGHTMWNFPLPYFLHENYTAIGILQLLLTAAIMVVNQNFFISGTKSIIHGAPNMDALVSIGAGAAFIYSVYTLFAMCGVQGEEQMKYMHDFYFESAGMILTLITVGKLLEARSKGKTTDAIKGLMRLSPKTATVMRGTVRTEVPIEDVRVGETFFVLPGQNIPLDGIVKDGTSAVNESALTGESIPQDKAPGDTVYAATLNQSGFLTCEATKVGEDTTLSQIIRMVSDAAATKAPIAKVADRVSGVFVPIVMAIALLTSVIWLLLDKSAGFALARGISVLVISCPCALGLATPVAIMVGSGIGAKHGTMFKTASSLEETGKVQIVALDKTGTITNGEPEITDIIPNGISEEELIFLAYILEKNSEHPLSKAIVNFAEKEGDVTQAHVRDFTSHTGKGLSALWENKLLAGGKTEFIADMAQIPKEAQTRAQELANEGKTPLFFSHGDKFIGIIAVADTLKEDAKEAISELKGMGIRVIMLTGDNERTAKAIGNQAGVDEVAAGIMPDGKEAVVRRLKEKGKVAMVGDGINDAPALTSADIGIAIGAGTDVAIDAADVVLMKSRLRDVPAAIRLSRATLRNIHENLFYAFIYNIIGIPLAAGVLIPALGITLSPMFGAAAMSLSSFCVVSNALRLNFFKVNKSKKDKKIKNAIKEEKLMEENKKYLLTAKVEGMMCGHCEARVKKTLEEITGCESARASHESAKAEAVFITFPDKDAVKKAILNDGYTVSDIEIKDI